ncbi:MAG: hypothetical protein FWH36_03040 [Lentimicrobiaceae bacterium]|nr:hypothetical protein [Lentimicrobiaceae bacterium]
MSTSFKKYGLIFFSLSLIVPLKGQVFVISDSIPTNISSVVYDFLPVQSEENFNFLLYSTKNKKQNFELITVKDTVIVNRLKIKNKGLEGDGSWYKSAVMDDKRLLLLHADGFLVVYEKNKKGNYSLKETLSIKGRKFETISLLDSENILLANSYNYYNKEKLYDDYALSVFNLRTKKVICQKEIDLGKGILLSHFSTMVSIESKQNKIAVAHPTLPFIYIYNDKLEPIDTICALFQNTVSVDSVVNAVFNDSFLEINRTKPKTIIQTIENKKINELEQIEKVFWLNDDVLGYTIRQPLSFSQARMFVFYSVSAKKELYKKASPFTGSGLPYNFVSSTRILINNNKTIWYGFKHKDDESDIYYQFKLYDFQLLNGAE